MALRFFLRQTLLLSVHRSRPAARAAHLSIRAGPDLSIESAHDLLRCASAHLQSGPRSRKDCATAAKGRSGPTHARTRRSVYLHRRRRPGLLALRSRRPLLHKTPLVLHARIPDAAQLARHRDVRTLAVASPAVAAAVEDRLEVRALDGGPPRRLDERPLERHPPQVSHVPADGRRAVFLAAVVGERRQHAVAAQAPALGAPAGVAHQRPFSVHNSPSRSASILLLLARPRASRHAATLRLLAKCGSWPASSSSSLIHPQPNVPSSTTGTFGQRDSSSRKAGRSACSRRPRHTPRPRSSRAVTRLKFLWQSRPMCVTFTCIPMAVSLLESPNRTS